ANICAGHEPLGAPRRRLPAGGRWIRTSSTATTYRLLADPGRITRRDRSRKKGVRIRQLRASAALGRSGGLGLRCPFRTPGDGQRESPAGVEFEVAFALEADRVVEGLGAR